MIHKPLFPNSGNYRPVAKRNLIKKQNRIKKEMRPCVEKCRVFLFGKKT